MGGPADGAVEVVAVQAKRPPGRAVTVTLEVLGARALRVQITRGRLKRAPKCSVLAAGSARAPCYIFMAADGAWCDACEARNNCWEDARLAAKSLSSGLTTYRARRAKYGPTAERGGPCNTL